MTASSLSTILTKSALRRAASDRYFERGEEYYLHNRVRHLTQLENTMKAKVLGQEAYRVTLWVKNAALAFTCTCPVGAEGVFCKHAVAVGLAWLDEKHPKDQKEKKPSTPLVDIKTFLARQDKNALVEIILEQSLNDDRLREKLLMGSAKSTPGGPGLAAYREAIDSAVQTDGFVDYHSAYDYVRGIEQVVESMKDLLPVHPSEVIELTEYALTAVESAMGSIDDSNGHMRPLLDELQELHHKACRKTTPDPENLARRLFEWELRSGYEVFFGAVETYRDVLGEKGLKTYRRLAETEWSKIPALKPGQSDSRRHETRFTVTHIMESLAKIAGNVDELVAIKSKDLSNAYDFLEVAQIYKESVRDDLALEWAERGIKSFPELPDPRLMDFLAEEYHARKRHDEAMGLIWAQLELHPHLDYYRKLKLHADRLKSWDRWRQKALEFLHESIEKEKRIAKKDQWAWARHPDHSELVRIFLWEKDVEAAWQEAKTGGCVNELWMKLAALREKNHPEDALSVYQNQIGPTLSMKNNVAYEEAVKLLRKMEGLFKHLNRCHEFSAYLESVRVAHKPKRNFMKLLDQTKWASPPAPAAAT